MEARTENCYIYGKGCEAGTYHKEEWDSIRRFICTKSFHFANQQISYPHLFLLAFDCLASLKCEDLPTVRALLICMKYAAEINSFDRFLSL